MPDRVFITDVSPRDGLQNEQGFVPTADKVRLIGSLVAAGVDEVEAASFVSAKWVPQLGDAEGVLSVVREAGWFGPSGPPRLTVLVPNETGFERALAFHSAEFPLKIAVFTAASETFNRKNTNASIAESVERFRAFVPRAIGMGMRVRMYVSCAISCPYEGAIDPIAVRRVCDDLIKMVDPDAFDNGEVEIDLGDTIGAATPGNVRALIEEFDAIELMSLVLHLHDTHGRAAECVRAALDMGVQSFDGSVAGLGGCPYAGTKEKPAPGNISTETLVRTVHDAGFVTGVDPDALAAAAAIARKLVGRARESAV